jgi:hypothetical protein
MPSVWPDKASPRQLTSMPSCGEENPESIRIEYGFNELQNCLEFERQMDLACRTLTWLLKDIQRIDEGFNIGDSIKLRQLIRYLYHSLISASMNEAKSWEHGASPAFLSSYENLGGTIKVLEECFDKDSTEFRDLTSMTLLELIARIIAQKHNGSLSIDQYRDEFGKLHVLKELEKYQRTWRRNGILIGLPTLIFICIHTTNSDKGDTGPHHVIATTREKWPLLPKIETLIKESRRERLQNPEEIRDRTNHLWNQVQFKYNELAKEVKPSTERENPSAWKKVVKKTRPKPQEDENTKKDRIIRARKAIVADRNPTQPLHCTKDEAAAILFPDRMMLGRCFKCQSLYNYTIHPTAKANESSDSCFRQPLNYEDKQWQLKGYPAGSCAEDLAHILCNAVNAKYPPRPAATGPE